MDETEKRESAGSERKDERGAKATPGPGKRKGTDARRQKNESVRERREGKGERGPERRRAKDVREGNRCVRARYIGRTATEPQQRIPTRDQSERSGTEAWWASETGVLVPVIIREPLIMRRFAGDEGLSLDFVQCAPFDNLRSSCLARVQGGPTGTPLSSKSLFFILCGLTRLVHVALGSSACRH